MVNGLQVMEGVLARTWVGREATRDAERNKVVIREWESHNWELGR